MTDDIERNARGLTKAQRRELIGGVRSIGSPERFVLWGKLAEAAMIPTRAVLSRRGLIEEGRFGPTMLTPLGLRVRAYLQENPDA